MQKKFSSSYNRHIPSFDSHYCNDVLQQCIFISGIPVGSWKFIFPPFCLAADLTSLSHGHITKLCCVVWEPWETVADISYQVILQATCATIWTDANHLFNIYFNLLSNSLHLSHILMLVGCGSAFTYSWFWFFDSPNAGSNHLYETCIVMEEESNYRCTLFSMTPCCRPWMICTFLIYLHYTIKLHMSTFVMSPFHFFSLIFVLHNPDNFLVMCSLYK